MAKQRAKYKIEEYDAICLREARQRIMIVYNYHYGANIVTRRLETIIKKIDLLIEEVGGDSKE